MADENIEMMEEQELAPFDPTQKKKKKKVVIQGPVEDVAESSQTDRSDSLPAEYVICLGCQSPDTILSKENRLFFLKCEKCGSQRCVTQIKAGFVARVGLRKT